VLRLFLLSNLLLLNLLACKGGYDSCIKKVNDSNTIQKKSLSIPVKNNKRLIYSSAQPNAKILKHDPFLGLYLIEDKSKFAYDFEINMRLQLGSAIVDKKRAIEAKVLKNQVGLNSLARFSGKYKVPALVTSSCCALEGIVTHRGIIQKEYIQRFLLSKTIDYGDIGIRVNNEKGSVLVTARDPYMSKNPFQKGDCIVMFDGKKMKAASVLMRQILFAKIGSKHKVKVKRGTKFLNFNVIVHKRYGGGNVSDTFLESKGIYFDENMKIVKLSEDFKEYGLLIGDRLIQVNGVFVKTEDELRKYIEDFKDFSSLLFERKNFQFFVNIK
jgi:PDZ domain